MSYILEALKRSERERGQGAVSPLTADLRIADTERGPSRSPWPWVGAALLAGVLLGAAGWWLALRASDHGSAPAPLAGPVKRVGTASIPPPAPPPAHPATGATAVPPAPAPAPARGAAPTPVPAHPATGATTEVPVPVPPAARVPAAPPAPAGPPARSPAPAAAPPAASPAPVVDLSDLPVAFRDSVPKLHIEVYVYSPQPALRWVLIGLHRYREGDRLPGGVQLERITADGLILDYAGRRFRLPRPG